MSIFTVTTPATELSLLTIEELRAASGVTDPRRDNELMALGRAASTSIARQCCVVADNTNFPTLLKETCTETFRWASCGPLQLSRRPVTSIVSVAVNGALHAADTYEIVSGRNLYGLSGDDLADWSSGRIVVVYQAGYESAQGDLKLACSKLVTALFAETGRDPSLKRDTVEGVGAREYWVAPTADPFLSKEIGDLLSPYREYWI